MPSNEKQMEELAVYRTADSEGSPRAVGSIEEREVFGDDKNHQVSGVQLALTGSQCSEI